MLGRGHFLDRGTRRVDFFLASELRVGGFFAARVRLDTASVLLGRPRSSVQLVNRLQLLVRLADLRQLHRELPTEGPTIAPIYPASILIIMMVV